MKKEILTITLLFVVIVVTVVIHICFVWRALRNESENGNNVQRGNKRATKMSNEDLKSIPCFNYKEPEQGSPVDCVICLDNFKSGEKCKMLPNCKHIFHAHCIDSWLLKRPICPVCRTCANPKKISSFTTEEGGISRNVGVELT